jgi:peptide/nickel transport system permease protein
VAALAVISVYVLMGLSVAVGLVSLTDAENRVGPNNTPAFWGWNDRKISDRVNDAEFYLNFIETGISQIKKGAAPSDVRLGGRTLAALPTARLEELHGEALESFDAISEVEDLSKDAEAQRKLAAVESTIQELLPVPSGTRGTVQWLRTSLGTDRQGRSIFFRSVYSASVALKVGIIVGLASTLVGSVLGAAAGFYGGWVDHAVTWVYSTLSSIPNLVLLALLAYVFQNPIELKFINFSMDLSSTLWPVYIALASTFWIGPCRVTRGEVLKIRELEYVQAATVLGFRKPYIVLHHVLPNSIHLMLINFSLLFIAAIKSEVILTFLGLGVKQGASWGIMISQSAQEVVNGVFWQIGAATVFMFLLVLAFNIVSDALQDAFDPKHVG